MKRAAIFVGLVLTLSGCSRKTNQATEHHEDHKEDVVEIGLEAQKHIGLQVVPAA